MNAKRSYKIFRTYSGVFTNKNSMSKLLHIQFSSGKIVKIPTCLHFSICMTTPWQRFDGSNYSTGWHKKNGNFWKTQQKLKKSKKKKLIDRNWTITICLSRDSNPNYQCLKITSCRWRPPPHRHSFTATTHFKSSRSFVSPCVCCMLCRMRLCRILQRFNFCQ